MGKHYMKPRRCAPRTATIVPFPPARDVGYIRKQAAMIAGMSAEGGEAYLRSQLAIKGNAMRRKGITEIEISSLLRELQSAIRSALFRHVLLRNPREPA